MATILELAQTEQDARNKLAHALRVSADARKSLDEANASLQDAHVDADNAGKVLKAAVDAPVEAEADPTPAPVPSPATGATNRVG